MHGCTHDLKQRAANKRMSVAGPELGLQLKWTRDPSPGYSGSCLPYNKAEAEHRGRARKNTALKQKEWQTVTESVGIMKHDRTRKWSRLKFMTRCSCQRSGLRCPGACSLKPAPCYHHEVRWHTRRTAPADSSGPNVWFSHCAAVERSEWKTKTTFVIATLPLTFSSCMLQ